MECDSMALNLVLSKPTNSNPNKSNKMNTYRKKQLKKHKAKVLNKKATPGSSLTNNPNLVPASSNPRDRPEKKKIVKQVKVPRKEESLETTMIHIPAPAPAPVRGVVQPKECANPSPMMHDVPSSTEMIPKSDNTSIMAADNKSSSISVLTNSNEYGSRKNPNKSHYVPETYSKNTQALDTLILGQDTHAEPVPSRSSRHIFGDKLSTFAQLDLEPNLVTILTKPVTEGGLGLVNPTTVQLQSIPKILSGVDVMIKSETGSGKTLAFLLPVLQRLLLCSRPQRLSRREGTQILILTPTRELCTQITQVCARITSGPLHYIVSSGLTGGEKKKSEKARLRKGVSILVATPGRLLDHLMSTRAFDITSCRFLILDEADRLLDMGFEKQVREILALLNAKRAAHITRQTILVSATIHERVSSLAKGELREPISWIDADANAKADVDMTTKDSNDIIAYKPPQQLKQHFVLVPAKLRFSALSSFLKTHTQSQSKMVVFFSTCDSVDFHYQCLSQFQWPMMRGASGSSGAGRPLFQTQTQPSTSSPSIDDSGTNNNNPNSLYRLHGNISQVERSDTLSAFATSDSGVLLCTDVAARGLNLSDIEWIVQFDPPTEIKDYVHRIGRTARSGAKGSSVLFLLPDERQYVAHLERHALDLMALSLTTMLTLAAGPHEFLHSKKKTMAEVVHHELQYRLETLVCSLPNLKTLSAQAFHSFVRSYATHAREFKSVFHVRGLHLGHVAKSFGLKDPPASATLVTQSKDLGVTGSLKKRHAEARVVDERRVKREKKHSREARGRNHQVSEFAE